MEPHVLHMQLHLAHEAWGTFRAEQRHSSQRDLAFGACVSVRGRSCIFNVTTESISNITKQSKDMIEA
jgi:hypothetical protein